MTDRIEWENPEIEAITDTNSRADLPDISVRNGLLIYGGGASAPT